MSGVTTIKVPVDLRDRIAAQARTRGTTLASVIERALDAADEEAFWARVAADNARSHAERTDTGSAASDEGGLRDHLEPGDDALGRDDW